ncbi:MAG: Trm112 family protein [Candidatus Bathyarchaeota archaeon]|nr:MAG: Trm112 family protein [Candidatus Bathyarchaeota archaeon]
MDILACPATYMWKCVECGYIYPPAEDEQICTFDNPPKKCPKCGSTTFEGSKFFPLKVHVFEEEDEIVEGVIVCPKCQRWYPIRDEIPELLPDELREARDELHFLRKWKDRIPKEILSNGKPFSLKKSSKKP